MSAELNEHVLKKDRVILEEKIKIFEKFLEKNKKITEGTIFEGYPIGQWARQIRYSVNKRKNIKPTKEQLDKLRELGILDRQIDSTLDEKIDKIIQWRKKYPKIKIYGNLSEKILSEYCQNKKDKESFYEEYNKIKKYLEYLKERKIRKKVTNEQLLKCKEGNIGGAFGYSAKIEKLAKKSGQNLENIYYIITKYETMNNFKSLYIKGELNKDDLLLAQKTFKRVFDIDLNSNGNYDNLVIEFMKSCNLSFENMEFYSSEELKKSIDERLSETQKNIIKRRFGLLENEEKNSPKKSYRSMCKELNITEQAITEAGRTAMKKLDCNRKRILVFRNKEFQNFTEYEKKLFDRLGEKIFSKDVMYLNSSYEILQNDEEYKELLIRLGIKVHSEDFLDKSLKDIEKFKGIIYIINLLEKVNICKVRDILDLSLEDLMSVIDLSSESWDVFVEKLDLLGIRRNENKKFKLNGYENISKKSSIIDNCNVYSAYFLDMSLEKLELSERTYHSLKKAEINEVRDIMNLSFDDLKNIKGLGITSICEIKEKLIKESEKLKTLKIKYFEKIPEDSLMEVKNFDSEMLNEIMERIVKISKIYESVDINEFINNIINCANKRLELKYKNQKANELENLYLEQLQNEKHTIDEN